MKKVIEPRLHWAKLQFHAKSKTKEINVWFAL